MQRATIPQTIWTMLIPTGMNIIYLPIRLMFSSFGINANSPMTMENSKTDVNIYTRIFNMIRKFLFDVLSGTIICIKLIHPSNIKSKINSKGSSKQPILFSPQLIYLIITIEIYVSIKSFFAVNNMILL